MVTSFHEIPILTTPLVGGGVLEIEVFLDVVGSELNTGLLVGDRALRADTYGVPSISNDLVNISGIILTGVVGLKDGGSNLVLDQTLDIPASSPQRGVIKDHINDIHGISVNLRHRHGGRVRAAFCRVANGDDGVRVTVFRQLKEVVQLVLIEQQTFRFKGLLLLELALKLLRTQKLPLLPEIGSGENLFALSLVLIIALVRHEIEGGIQSLSKPSPPAVRVPAYDRSGHTGNSGCR